MALEIDKIIQYRLRKDQYFDVEYPKTQVFIHHTAGGSNPFICVDGWNSNLDKIGTAFVIAGKPKNETDKFKDGDIMQCFSSKHYAYHLGIPSETFKKYDVPYKRLDKTSVGIEICNWGYLTKQPNGTFKNYVGGMVPVDEVVDMGGEFRGHRYYHAYTDAQILAVRDLLNYLGDKYGISKKYNEGMWEVNQACLNGTNGIWSHTSCRADKFDVNPQPKLISMLKTMELNGI